MIQKDANSPSHLPWQLYGRPSRRSQLLHGTIQPWSHLQMISVCLIVSFGIPDRIPRASLKMGILGFIPGAAQACVAQRIRQSTDW